MPRQFVVKLLKEKRLRENYKSSQWRQRLGTLCCSAWTWIDISLNYKLQRNYEELKVTMCLWSWGKLQAKRYKKTKIRRKQCHFWKARSKTGCWEQKLDTAQAPSHSRCSKSLQLCTTLCNDMDCSPPVSSVHWISRNE